VVDGGALLAVDVLGAWVYAETWRNRIRTFALGATCATEPMRFLDGWTSWKSRSLAVSPEEVGSLVEAGDGGLVAEG
jgi:hypothetical protein